MEGVELENTKLNPILKNKKIAFSLIALGLMLSFIDNFWKMNIFVGAWHIVSYLLVLLPLAYMIWSKKIINPYTKWFMPFLLVMIADMFYYNNDMVQLTLPIVFYILVFIVYMTSMHSVHSLHQVIFIRNYKIGGLSYLKAFFRDLIVYNIDRKIYTRIGLALLITLPFLITFAMLLSKADSNYSQFFKKLFSFDIPFEVHYIFTLPLMFGIYMLLFIGSFSNFKERKTLKDSNKLDMLVAGIFLGMINLLFLSFIVMQVSFLSTSHTPEGINIADFAREGFFQLMMVMGLVSLIFLFILRRHKNEKLTTVLLIGLLAQSIIMGIVSLKKMYLYQSIMGATVLRYYVEWFDYFLLIVLVLGIVFLVKRYAFTKLLDIITILGLVSFTLVVSLNIDTMVAKHNIEKFKNTPKKLDKDALRWQLSIDALPVITEHKIKLKEKKTYVSHSVEKTSPWYEKHQRKNCDTFATYHYGYCSILKKYGN
ncbi:MAG: DUF4173 domain-containing protein [Campylobacterota bacterium]|nr:DUF4173 domain-containing protein [Campylobacterota bacterium]